MLLVLGKVCACRDCDSDVGGGVDGGGVVVCFGCGGVVVAVSLLFVVSVAFAVVFTAVVVVTDVVLVDDIPMTLPPTTCPSCSLFFSFTGV